MLAGAGRAAELLGDGAGLLADSGLLDTDLVKNAAAAAAGLPDLSGVDQAMLQDLRELTGLGIGGVADLAAGLTTEQKFQLAAAAAGLAAGGGPEGLVESLPSDLLAGVFDAVGRTDPELLAKLAGVDPTRTPIRPPTSLAVSPKGMTGKALDLGATAAAKLPPSVAAAGGVFGTLLGGGIPGLDRLTGGAGSAAGNTPDRTRAEPAAPPPSRRLAAGRPVPPRLRGVVSRYFAASGDAAGVAGAGGSGQTPSNAE